MRLYKGSHVAACQSRYKLFYMPFLSDFFLVLCDSWHYLVPHGIKFFCIPSVCKWNLGTMSVTSTYHTPRCELASKASWNMFCFLYNSPVKNFHMHAIMWSFCSLCNCDGCESRSLQGYTVLKISFHLVEAKLFSCSNCLHVFLVGRLRFNKKNKRKKNPRNMMEWMF